MNTANHELPSLVTANASDGLKLAGEMADRLHARINAGRDHAERPGGMNYLMPAPVSKEIIASILFHTIAAANNGWTGRE